MGTMTAHRRLRLRWLSLASLVLCAGLWACSLNPQPIPPDEDRTSGGEDYDNDGTAGAPGASDSGASSDSGDDGGHDAADDADDGGS